MYSYVQLEKEISGSYREQLNTVKRSDEIEEIFARKVMELLLRVSENSIQPNTNEIRFVPDTEPFYELRGDLAKSQKISEAMIQSDLPAIIKRMALDALGRYRHIINDDDRMETFRFPKNK